MRYSRQIIFDKIGENGQMLLSNSTVSIVGVGALGSASAEMLARSGIGKLILIDRDLVEVSNLQRQSLYSEKDIDEPKVFAAQKALNEINSEVKIKTFFVDLDYDNINSINSDLILDCTDNFYTRFLINDYSLKNNIPWIYAAVIGATGTTFNIIPGSTCLGCIAKEPTSIIGTCDSEGILATTPHSIASIQVTEAIKILTRQNFNKPLVHYDVWNNKFTKLKVSKNPKCNPCNNIFDYLSGKKSSNVTKLCGSSSYQFRISSSDIDNLSRKLSKIGSLRVTPYCLFFNDITIFKSGRIVIKAESTSKAKSIFTKYIT